jgi:hypothetical protein
VKEPAAVGSARRASRASSAASQAAIEEPALEPSATAPAWAVAAACSPNDRVSAPRAAVAAVVTAMVRTATTAVIARRMPRVPRQAPAQRLAPTAGPVPATPLIIVAPATAVVNAPRRAISPGLLLGAIDHTKLEGQRIRRRRITIFVDGGEIFHLRQVDEHTIPQPAAPSAAATRDYSIAGRHGDTLDLGDAAGIFRPHPHPQQLGVLLPERARHGR